MKPWRLVVCCFTVAVSLVLLFFPRLPTSKVFDVVSSNLQGESKSYAHAAETLKKDSQTEEVQWHWVYSMHYQTPHLAYLQGMSLIQFLKMPVLVHLVGTSCNLTDQKHLERVAESLNNASVKEGAQNRIRFLTLHFTSFRFEGRDGEPTTIACHENRKLNAKEGMVYNWCWHSHMMNQAKRPAYVGFLHADMLLVNAFDSRPYLDARGIYGSPATYRHSQWHLHPQLIFFRLASWDWHIMQHVNFGPSGSPEAMDTGGSMTRLIQLGRLEERRIPKRYFEMFNEVNMLDKSVIPGIDEVNSAVRLGSFDPRSNKSFSNKAQYGGYEVFDDAWVHSRHSKLTHLQVRGVNVTWTSHLKAHPEWSHPKNAYMKGLVEGRLWMCQSKLLDALRMPSGLEIDGTADAVEKTSRKIGRIALSNNLQLLEPDNAYMKGFLDAVMRFWGKSSMPGSSRYVNTRPPGFC